MKFDSYITSGTKTAFTVDVNQKLIKYNKLNLKKAAFTLAETLITLTIIGVIAALTIPNLISSYQKHTYVVGLKKAYSQLQNAMKMIPITQGCSPGDLDCAGWYEGYHKDENGHWVNTPVTNIEGQEFSRNISNKQAYLISKQFKINKLCYSGSTDPECVKATSTMLHVSSTNSASLFILNDGMIFRGGSTIGVDINGFKGPNKWGRDQFYFDITYEYEESRYNIPQGTVMPYGSKLFADIYNQPNYYWRNNNDCTTENVNKDNWQAAFCAGRVLEEDAMNY